MNPAISSRLSMRGAPSGVNPPFKYAKPTPTETAMRPARRATLPESWKAEATDRQQLSALQGKAHGTLPQLDPDRARLSFTAIRILDDQPIITRLSLQVRVVEALKSLGVGADSTRSSADVI